MYKKIITLLSLCLISYAYSQDPGVEKNMFTVQTGILGAWVNNEFRLANDLTLRSEAGFALSYATGMYEKNRYAAVPIFSIEPRWYYNIKGRAEKGRTVKNNAANFTGLQVSYVPDWFTVSNVDNYKVADQINIIPRWGLRRTIGQSNFNYEFGIGLGYKISFLKQYGYKQNESKAIFDTTFRIGYKF